MSEIFTTPNLITFLRLLLIPFFVLAFFQDQYIIAALLFLGFALGDGLDGYLARKKSQRTVIGSLFDGLTDLIAFASILISFLLKKYLSAQLIVILLIPLFITLISRAIYYFRTKDLPHPLMEKITAILAYLTIIMILLDFVYQGILIILVAILAYISMLLDIQTDINLYIK